MFMSLKYICGLACVKLTIYFHILYSELNTEHPKFYILLALIATCGSRGYTSFIREVPISNLDRGIDHPDRFSSPLLQIRDQ